MRGVEGKGERGGTELFFYPSSHARQASTRVCVRIRLLEQLELFAWYLNTLGIFTARRRGGGKACGAGEEREEEEEGEWGW